MLKNLYDKINGEKKNKELKINLTMINDKNKNLKFNKPRLE